MGTGPGTGTGIGAETEAVPGTGTDSVARLTASNSQILNLKRSHTHRGKEREREQYKTCKTKKGTFSPSLSLWGTLCSQRYNGASFMFTKRLCSALNKRASAPAPASVVVVVAAPTGTGTVVGPGVGAGVLIKQFVEFRVNCEKTTRTCNANLATNDTVQGRGRSRRRQVRRKAAEL